MERQGRGVVPEDSKLKPGIPENINLRGIFCINNCENQDFSIRYLGRKGSAFDGMVFKIQCNSCGNIVASKNERK